NRNRGFSAATGTHVMSADDDHTHPSGFVGAITTAIQSDEFAVWTVGERRPNYPSALVGVPGELRSNGTIGTPEDPNRSAAVSCGSTEYPRKVFDLVLRCDETYVLGGLLYLWGLHLRTAGL